jgi:hypothetical protein
VAVTNNIAAGGIFSGFVVPGHECGNYESSKFFGNVAHSIGGPKMGTGITYYPDPNIASSKTCVEGSFNAAYKNYYQGVYHYSETTHIKITSHTLIDNRNRFGATMQVNAY